MSSRFVNVAAATLISPSAGETRSATHARERMFLCWAIGLQTECRWCAATTPVVEPHDVGQQGPKKDTDRSISGSNTCAAPQHRLLIIPTLRDRSRQTSGRDQGLPRATSAAHGSRASA